MNACCATSRAHPRPIRAQADFMGTHAANGPAAIDWPILPYQTSGGGIRTRDLRVMSKRSFMARSPAKIISY